MPSEYQSQDQKKVAQLQAFRTEMERSPDIGDELFFFPEYKTINGYLGTGQAWFVGEKPSTTSFPDSSVELLYDSLRTSGFTNAHITDLSKERGSVPADGISHDEITRQRPYFRREVTFSTPN